MKSNLHFDNFDHSGPGAPLSRQISKSLQTPQNLTHYHSVFSANNRQTGFLELKIAGEQRVPWVKKWFVFEDGSLNFADSPLAKQDEYQSISMERVISLRADSNPKLPVITVVTLDGTFYLKTPDLEEMRQWLFSFQKSVALVITKLLYKRQRGLQEDSRIWGSALGDANGEGGINLVRAQQRFGMGLKRGQLVLDGPGQQLSSSIPSPTSPFMKKTVMNHNYSNNNNAQGIPSSWETDDDARESPNRQAYSLSSSRMMAVSPAIPIGMTQMMREVAKTNLASSYKEETTAPISAYMNRAVHLGHHQEDNYDEDDVDDAAYSDVHQSDNDLDEGSHRSDLEGDDDQDDDGMMFDMDENVEERAEAKQHHHQQQQQQGHAHHSSLTQQLNKAANLASQSYDANHQSGLSSSFMSRPRRSITGGSSVATSFSSTRSALAGVSTATGYIAWSCGSCSDCGIREKNEDRFVQDPCVLLSSEEKAKDVDSRYFGGGNAQGCAYFAVYDGHGGDEASQFLMQEMHHRLIRHELFYSNTEEAIVDVCKRMDKDFLEICARLRKGSGTTALGAVLHGSRLTVFNIGDSMAVLCSGGVAVEMSNSHKPGRPDEAERISKANGWITEEKELLMGRLHRMDLNDPLAVDRAQNMSWTTIHRVCGEISVSRSIGDPDYKNLIPGMKQEDWYFRWPEGHSQILEADLLIPDPECKVHEITQNDEFLVLASDGLWDVLTSFDVIKIIQKSFQEGRDPDYASKELCDLAIRLGSSDNVTVVIVRFLHHKS